MDYKTKQLQLTADYDVGLYKGHVHLIIHLVGGSLRLFDTAFNATGTAKLRYTNVYGKNR